MGDRSDFVAGFVIGGLLGTAVALLLAPRSGEETRTRLAGAAEDLGDRTRDRAEEVIQKLRVTAEDISQRGRAKLDEGAARLRETLERGREHERIEEQSKE